ncbi:dTDP-glucose 4,6-dehydratase [Marivirga tractuosa]|uniref:NAD-dependent epimerase/dehydratase n=1 Tax=Marivirga tractuosa (strain ATCC 23168 / DSM 4126 / NBRC 15989 / NCIMB 1408 / VKM B-1430 / H-43) TaxID=643867 RepID=E4TU78_MARTH|nr:SDR family oxidoreductase [Marivirga tractuosa]ADR21006.1 NAD-dependent epimerase/dehydratase [Marivirga tractuosa DSM 4126]BDD14539.1 dTDP-glucose 4,6-dehydratase [Marivirga tractuosa]
MKKILITGGAGYIGSALIEKLLPLQEVEQIVIYDNLSRNNYHFFLGNKLPNQEKINFIQGELLDTRKLKKALNGIDTVIHLAAKVTTPFADADPHYFEQSNHWGTAELVYAVEESEVDHFIFASSVSVFGSSTDLIGENHHPNPRTIYGISKLRGEEHVARLMDKINTQILRLGNVYGFANAVRFDAVINRFMFDANFNNQIAIHGDGKQHRPFISIQKASEILKEVSINHDIPSDYYNVVDQNLQVLDIVDALKAIYPDMEFTFINQHLKLRELLVSPDSKLQKYIDFPKSNTNLKDDLMIFKEALRF